MSLKDKRVLITAGPTRVPIDDVRVISNTATAATGFILAKKFKDAGAKVTLVHGVPCDCSLKCRVKVLRFKFFDELNQIITRQLKSGKVDVFIQTAAVSDYKPSLIRRGKISSADKELKLTLVPTVKIIDRVKKLSPDLFLVGFKFEPQALRAALIKEARSLISKSKADLVVANTKSGNKYRAYIVSAKKT
ncbi:phosphopantothenoylcysteine decarboxylase, partial [bacterium]